jgi:hypothetical protein
MGYCSLQNFKLGFDGKKSYLLGNPVELFSTSVPRTGPNRIRMFENFFLAYQSAERLGLEILLSR